MGTVSDNGTTGTASDGSALFLGARTKSGLNLSDEADIVSWNNPRDPIVDVFFFDENGDTSMPVLCDEAIATLKEADAIILSSGTQWSSLIPTYASEGFKKTMANFSGKVVMVMNRVPDKDAPNQSATDLVKNLVPKYFKEGQIDLLIDSTGHDIMRFVETDTAEKLLRSVTSRQLMTDSSIRNEQDDVFGPGKKITTHDSAPLASGIAVVLFQEYLGASNYIFDYDDTLVGRGNTHAISSNFNKQSLVNNYSTMSICTGNSIKAIDIHVMFTNNNHFGSGSPVKPITVFADGGVNKYEYDTRAGKNSEAKPYTLVECLVPEARFGFNGTKTADKLISELRLGGIPAAKIENRGDVMLAIKPIDPEYREITRNLSARILVDNGLAAKSAGRTSIEIANKYVSKEAAVKHVLSSLDPGETIVFVGDEFDGQGNDRCVKVLANQDARIKCLAVKSPSDTAFFFIAHRAYKNEFTGII